MKNFDQGTCDFDKKNNEFTLPTFTVPYRENITFKSSKHH